MFRALLHFCAFALVLLPVSAQVYKWVDDNGVTHYGERPPQGRKASEVPNRLATPDPSAGAPKAPDADKAQSEAARRRENCTQQRELLARIKQPPGTEGGKATSRDPEREAAQARQEQAVAEACGA